MSKQSYTDNYDTASKPEDDERLVYGHTKLAFGFQDFEFYVEVIWFGIKDAVR